MATPKPKKSGKKPAAKASTAAAKETKATTKAAPVAAETKALKGFFARKCDPNENILTIFKTPKIWGALIAEAFGTMMIVMLMLTLGIQPLYIVLALVCIYAAIVGISGAHFNPLITAGMMATRRMSAIRGVLYMLAQLLGGWIGALIVNAFRINGGSGYEAVVMADMTANNFWAVALVELFGAIILAFCFARAIRYAHKQTLTFAFIVTSSMVLAIIFGLIITQSYFGFSNSFAFNPVVALMYQVLPTVADGIGELLQLAGLAIAAYIIVPMIGGILGFWLSDVATKLSAGGYRYEHDCECSCIEKEAKK